MSPSHEVQIRTRMFARVIGPLFAFSCITAVVRASDMKALVTDFGANPLWSWVTGAFVLTGGLIIVAVHQYWHGSPSIIVSLVGWLLALRGLLLLAFPSTFMSMTNSLLAAGARWHGLHLLCRARAVSDLRRLEAHPVGRRPRPQAQPGICRVPRN